MLIGKVCCLVICATLLGFVFQTGVASAEETGTLSGRILDINRQPVAGAEVYLYTNSDIRRPADFISAPSDQDGRYRVLLPPGEYWAAARLRTNGAQFGPLMPGDKHSAWPVEIEIDADKQAQNDFVVVNLREAARLVKKTEKVFKIQGEILGPGRKPVANAYAYANRSQSPTRLPDYLSAWTDDSGRYTLFLPKGTYYLGWATDFPLRTERKSNTVLTVDKNLHDVNLVYSNPNHEVSP